MNLTFSAVIEGRNIACEITSDTAIAAPVFCFSLLATAAVVEGGTLIRSEASYSEVQLPDIAANTPLKVVLRYGEDGFTPVNRAWLPLGAYLRHARGITALPALPAGVIRAKLAVHSVEGLRLVPPPHEWLPSGGQITVSGVQTDHEALLAVDALAQRNAVSPLLAPKGLPVEIITDACLATDAYVLTINPDKITVKAAGRGGVFYAGVTLLTLLNTHDGSLPLGQIADAPRFGWRGQHLDCARHFFRPKTIRQMLDQMALVKLNRFHWHFADDEAFRLELTSLPELAAQTALRGEGQLMPGLFGGGARAGGSYSQDDARAIIAHAKALNIEVMPEIEVTGHALAMTRVYPEMRDPDDIGDEVSVQGYVKNSVNPAMPETWRILNTMIEEVAGLFPFNVLHLGCDELAPNTWAGSPAIHRMKERNALPETEDVQGWMMDKLAATASTFGKRPAAWEEAAQGNNGGVGNGALLFSWTGQGPGVAAARAGYDVIMVPAQNAYFDLAHSKDPTDWGAAWAGFLPLEKTLDWAPVPAGAEDITDRVKGVQGTFWGEFTTQDSQLWPMILPRIMGLACKAWDAHDAMSPDRLNALAATYENSIFNDALSKST